MVSVFPWYRLFETIDLLVLKLLDLRDMMSQIKTDCY